MHISYTEFITDHPHCRVNILLTVKRLMFKLTLTFNKVHCYSGRTELTAFRIAHSSDGGKTPDHVAYDRHSWGPASKTSSERTLIIFEAAFSCSQAFKMIQNTDFATIRSLVSNVLLFRYKTYCTPRTSLKSRKINHWRFIW